MRFKGFIVTAVCFFASMQARSEAATQAANPTQAANSPQAVNATQAANATSPFIQAYDDITFLLGAPLSQAVTRETIDTKFQFGLRTRVLWSPGSWDFFFGYRQLATWNILAVSGPFRDIIFRPGLYFTKSFGAHASSTGAHTLTTGLEHFSNGRPFFGSPAAAPDYDDGSRGMNYAFIEWKFRKNGNIITALAKAGVGCGVGSYGGVGSYERHFSLFTQDLFLYYLGYLTVEYAHLWDTFGVHASVTPIWNKSIANVQLDAHWNFHQKWPGLYLEFHYGYDEALCICRPDREPLCYLRFGLRYSFSD